jgi:hypothetical protein
MPASHRAVGRANRSYARRRSSWWECHFGGSEPLQWLARAGFLARSLTYAVIAGLTVAIALNVDVRPAAANPQGALSVINSGPLGRVALGTISVALLAYAVWKLVQAVRGRGPEGGGGRAVWDRLANLGGGLVYVAFFGVAVAVLSGSVGNGSRQPKQTASQLLGIPGGEILLAIAGVALLLVSIYQAYDAISGRFANDNKIGQMSPERRRTFMVLGRVGILARAIIFSLVAYFLLRAAIELHAGLAVGVDGALARVHREPFGSWLLVLVAAGLFTFAAFSLLESRYRRL